MRGRACLQSQNSRLSCYFVLQLVFFRLTHADDGLPPKICNNSSGLAELCRGDNYHCVPASEPRQSHNHHQRKEYPFLNAVRLSWRALNGDCLKETEVRDRLLTSHKHSLDISFSVKEPSCDNNALSELTVILQSTYTSGTHAIRMGHNKRLYVCYRTKLILAAAHSVALQRNAQPVDLTLVTTEDRALTKSSSYWTGSAINHATYATIHGYHALRMDGKLIRDKRGLRACDDKASTWCKLNVLSEVLHKHSYALLLDSDTAFYDFDSRAESLMQQWGLFGESTTKVVAVSKDTIGKHNKDGGSHNMGVAFWRNSTLTHDLLKHWCNSVYVKGTPPKSCPSRYKRTFGYEQKCFDLVIWQNRMFNTLVQSLPAGIPFNHPWGTYIKHFWSAGYFRKHRNWAMAHALHHTMYTLHVSLTHL